MQDKTVKRFEKGLAPIRKGLARQYTPEFWADLANKAPELAGGPHLTPWFPSSELPVRIGWYQRFVWNALESHFWDGASWLVSPRGEKYDRSLKSFWPCWRGLSEHATTRAPRR